MIHEPPDFAALAAHYVEPGTRLLVERTTFTAAQAAPHPILGYLAALGWSVTTLDDLLDAITQSEDEELSAFQVREGIAVSHASQGSWVLFSS